VKRAEAGSGVVLRVFEHANRRARVKLRFGLPVNAAFLTNLMEEGREPLTLRDNSVTLELRPFEIATLVLELAK
jgi:alpha-mannosidase